MSRGAGRVEWWAELAAAVEAFSFRLAGGFYPDADDPDTAGLETPAGTVVVIGHAGTDLWQRFRAERHRFPGPDPLDRWTRAALAPIAAAYGATLVLPNDGSPFQPFQRWAMRAELVHPSPLGLLVHPRHGLWHALRAALLFPERRAVPPRTEAPSPCASCAAKPCLTACPVGAFDGTTYNVAACAAHVRSDAGTACREHGCRARHACPVAPDRAWSGDQQEFHMAAFLDGWG